MAARAVLLIALATLGLASVSRADLDKSSYFVVSYSRPKPLSSAKESQIKDGMTLKQVVAALGPGWIRPDEGVGVIQWFFDDGRALAIEPHWYQNEVITYKGQGGMSRMWWNR